MTREQYDKFCDSVFMDIKVNRDYYSRAKIIEMILERLEDYVDNDNSVDLFRFSTFLTNRFEYHDNTKDGDVYLDRGDSSKPIKTEKEILEIYKNSL